MDYSKWCPPMPPATYREPITKRPEDTETHYHCECGYDDYVNERTIIHTMRPLPLTNCPKCKREFVLHDPYTL